MEGQPDPGWTDGGGAARRPQRRRRRPRPDSAGDPRDVPVRRADHRRAGPRRAALGGAAGWGGISGTIYTAGGRFYYRITSAYTVLDAGQNGLFRPGFGSGSTRGALLMHELGHAMGLGHSDYTSQIMYPTILPRRTTGYGFWDRRALTRVGRAAGCVPR